MSHQQSNEIQPIKAIVGLGNPGPSYYHQRHSIGFRIIDELAHKHASLWRKSGKADIASIEIGSQPLLLIKSKTFMNESGAIVPLLRQHNIAPEEVLIIHDELELPFGKIAFKIGGSAKGHNGLKSIIGAYQSDHFVRLRFGIGRPEQRQDVPSYVLEGFTQPAHEVALYIEQAVRMVEDLCRHAASH